MCSFKSVVWLLSSAGCKLNWSYSFHTITPNMFSHYLPLGQYCHELLTFQILLCVSVTLAITGNTEARNLPVNQYSSCGWDLRPSKNLCIVFSSAVQLNPLNSSLLVGQSLQTHGQPNIIQTHITLFKRPKSLINKEVTENDPEFKGNVSNVSYTKCRTRLLQYQH